MTAPLLLHTMFLNLKAAMSSPIAAPPISSSPAASPVVLTKRQTLRPRFESVDVDLDSEQQHRPEQRAWTAALERHGAHHLDLLPEYLALEVMESGASDRLHAALLGRRRGTDWESLGVLAPKQLAAPRGVGWLLGARLHGYRVAGSQLIGAEPGDARIWLAEALEWVSRQRGEFLLIEDLIVGTPLDIAVRAAKRPSLTYFSPTGTQPRWLIDFEGDEDAYWDRFASKTRSTWRRKWRKLDQPDVERVTRHEQVEAFLQQAKAISDDTWQSRCLGPRIDQSAEEKKLFGWLAEQGCLRSYLLREAGRPIAFLIGTQYRGRFSYEEVGYLASEARKSPGQLLLIEALKDLWNHDRPQTFDFGGGDADYKRSFATREEASATHWLLTDNCKLRTMAAEWTGRQWVKSSVKRFLSSGQWRSRLRQCYRDWRAARTPSDTANAPSE